MSQQTDPAALAAAIESTPLDGMQPEQWADAVWSQTDTPTNVAAADAPLEALRGLATRTDGPDAAARVAFRERVDQAARVSANVPEPAVSRRWDRLPETDADRRFFDLRESGYSGWIDQDGYAVGDPFEGRDAARWTPDLLDEDTP
ncbi:hypothetical protein [Catenuloplanes japonicus]|uniref:hypothetical protein n=1 Tax=Catenuloplanes japonicus TaxID=33876 RepID=UPI000527D2E0|nr:hypothetical protein [Catenuloplanes japonicus]